MNMGDQTSYHFLICTTKEMGRKAQQLRDCLLSMRQMFSLYTKQDLDIELYCLETELATSRSLPRPLIDLLKNAHGCTFLFGYNMQRGSDAIYKGVYRLHKKEYIPQKLWIYCPYETPLHRFSKNMLAFRRHIEEKQKHFYGNFSNVAHLQYLLIEQLWLVLSPHPRDIPYSIQHDCIEIEGAVRFALRDVPFLSAYADENMYHQQLNDNSEMQDKLRFLLHSSLQLAHAFQSHTSSRARHAIRLFNSGHTQLAIDYLNELDPQIERSLNLYNHHSSLQSIEGESLAQISPSREKLSQLNKFVPPLDDA